MGLTLHFIPYSEIMDLGSARRVKKLLDIVKQDKIVLLEGKLRKQEEADLIEITMEEISSKFKGIELATIDDKITATSIGGKLKHSFVNAMLGDRSGFTVIGPANIVKEIKQNPGKIELMTQEQKRRRRK